MARRDLLRDSSDHASGELQYVLQQSIADAGEGSVPMVTADQALHHERVLTHTTKRDVTRVLFVSQNTALLNPTRQTLDGYVDISGVFDEVHILVLRRGIQPTQPVLRPHTNVWIYTVAERSWWRLHKAAKTMIKDQLVFADGFRPDLIVARDPFESALIVLWAQKIFNKPAQVHVLFNYLSRSFVRLASGNWLRRLVARYTMSQFKSIRTESYLMEQALKKRYPRADVSRLPKLNPYKSIAQVRRTLDLKKQYPQYVFSLLFVGSLSQHTTAFSVLEASQAMLRNPRISLLILGDGSAYKDCVRRAKSLNIYEQTIFIKEKVDVDQYLKAANILVVTDVDAHSEELVLRAAGAGIPMIIVRTEQRQDLFTHMESVYFCAAADPQEIAEGISVLMNDYNLRLSLAEEAQAIIAKKFHQDELTYRREYRDSIESTLFIEDNN